MAAEMSKGFGVLSGEADGNIKNDWRLNVRVLGRNEMSELYVRIKCMVFSAGFS
jgi:hypothetical protein